jgi:hypothetical protein
MKATINQSAKQDRGTFSSKTWREALQKDPDDDESDDFFYLYSRSVGIVPVHEPTLLSDSGNRIWIYVSFSVNVGFPIS